jgi:hypothetical protein
LKANWVQARQVLASPDWRPAYHFSAAAWLNGRADAWPRLGAFAECVDGWRVSTNPASNAYDPRVETAPIYRLRHIEPMELRTETEHWRPPAIAEESFCVQPLDVLLRRVGTVAAAPVSELHHRHPVDANLGIVRGLTVGQALWTAYCLNQPHYRDFLEASGSITALVRVGLRQIAEMPIAPKPDTVDALAERYFAALSRANQSLEQLFRLRETVEEWLADQWPDLLPLLDAQHEGHRWHWFAVEDLDDRFDMTAAEQRRLARKLQETGSAAPLGSLARINPREPRASRPPQCRALRLADLDPHFGISEHLPDRQQMAWRTQTRALAQYDVLISSFAGDPRVAFVPDPATGCILPTEQIITLCFHRFQGAYALLMESALVRAQWARLATGSVQHFVPPASASQLTVPIPEPVLAAAWHHELLEIMAKRRTAQRQIDEALSAVGRLYATLHPTVELPGRKVTT